MYAIRTFFILVMVSTIVAAGCGKDSKKEEGVSTAAKNENGQVPIPAKDNPDKDSNSSDIQYPSRPETGMSGGKGK